MSDSKGWKAVSGGDATTSSDVQARVAQARSRAPAAEVRITVNSANPGDSQTQIKLAPNSGLSRSALLAIVEREVRNAFNTIGGP